MPTAEELFKDNVMYNTFLSKDYQKKKNKYLDIYCGPSVYFIEPDEVINMLEKIQINLSRKTLYNWEKWGLISRAKFRNSRKTLYPLMVLFEIVATQRFIHDLKMPKDRIAEIREIAFKINRGQIPTKSIDDMSEKEMLAHGWHLLALQAQDKFKKL